MAETPMLRSESPEPQSILKSVLAPIKRHGGTVTALVGTTIGVSGIGYGVHERLERQRAGERSARVEARLASAERTNQTLSLILYRSGELLNTSEERSARMTRHLKEAIALDPEHEAPKPAEKQKVNRVPTLLESHLLRGLDPEKANSEMLSFRHKLELQRDRLKIELQPKDPDPSLKRLLMDVEKELKRLAENP